MKHYIQSCFEKPKLKIYYYNIIVLYQLPALEITYIVLLLLAKLETYCSAKGKQGGSDLTNVLPLK